MKQPIIIIGMHRSGTSLLSQLLQKSGVFMGKFQTSDFESLYFRKINEWILKQSHSSWDNPYNYLCRDKTIDHHLLKVCNYHFKSLNSTKYYGYKNFLKFRDIKKINYCWGWKDPMTTITIDLWLKLFENPKIIHIYRNPLDVALSLRERNKTKSANFHHNLKSKTKEVLLFGRVGYNQSSRIYRLDEGVKLWNEYISSALTVDRALHIKYEDMLSDTIKILEKVFNFINVKVDKPTLIEYNNMINKNNSFKFVNNTESINIFKTIKNWPNIIKLGYDKI